MSRIKLPAGPKPSTSKVDARDHLRDLPAAEIERQIAAALADVKRRHQAGITPEAATAQRTTSRDRYAGVVACETRGTRR